MCTILRFSNLVDKVNIRGVGNIFGLLLFAAMLCGTYEVVARYFFLQPTIWVWEENGLLVAVAAAFGTAYTFAMNSHIRVDIVYSRLSLRTQAILDACTSLFIFLFLVVLVWQFARFTLMSFQISEHSATTYSPLLYPYKILVSVGFFLCLIQGLANFLRNLTVAFAGRRGT